MAYYWFKAFHIVGVVVWFAGLFYLVRLFIYHVEAQAEPEPAQSILKKPVRNYGETPLQHHHHPRYGGHGGHGRGAYSGRCRNISTTAGCTPSWGWWGCLLGYHVYCGRLMKKLANDECQWSSKQLRALNEAPTLLLVTIVMLVVFKNNFPTTVTPWLIFGLIVVMAATIQLYARKRRFG